MEQLLEFLFKSGLRPLSILLETDHLERKVTRSELAAVLMLHFHGEMAMSALAAELGAPLSTMTSLVKRLVRKGLVKRHRSDKDQRVILVRLTDEGEQLALQAKATMESAFSRVRDVLSAEELQQLISLVMKVVKALQQKDPPETGKPNPVLRKIPIDD